MADKILNLRIDVTKINKAWLFKSEKTGSVYMDATVFYNEEQDTYGQNGMIVQSVPKSIFDAEKNKPKSEKTQGEILGNCKDFATQKGVRNEEAQPGTEIKGATAINPADDLPF